MTPDADADVDAVTSGAVPATRSTSRGWSSGLARTVGRLGWGVADQGISSLSNFALGLYVARTLGAYGFGAFTIAFTTYSVVLNASRGLGTDPMLVRYSHVDAVSWRRAGAAAGGTALVTGLVVTVLSLGVSTVLPGTLARAFVALGVVMPGLLLQDSWRFVFFAAGRGASAFVNDLVWTVLLIGALAVFRGSLGAGVGGCLLIFGATATFAGLLGSVQARIVPKPTAARGWVRDHRDLSVRYLLENVTGSGTSQVRAYVLGAARDLAAVGQVRAAEILMGPFLVILMGISQVAVPEASRALHRGGRQLRRFCLLLGGAQAIAAGAWAALVGVGLALGLGRVVLGDLARSAATLLPPIALTVVAACFTTAAAAGLRAMGAARRSLRAQLVSASLYLTGGVGGAIVAGAVGACWGTMSGTTLGAIITWRAFTEALREYCFDGTSVMAAAQNPG